MVLVTVVLGYRGEWSDINRVIPLPFFSLYP